MRPIAFKKFILVSIALVIIVASASSMAGVGFYGPRKYSSCASLLTTLYGRLGQYGQSRSRMSKTIDYLGRFRNNILQADAAPVINEVDFTLGDDVTDKQARQLIGQFTGIELHWRNRNIPDAQNKVTQIMAIDFVGDSEIAEFKKLFLDEVTRTRRCGQRAAFSTTSSAMMAVCSTVGASILLNGQPGAALLPLLLGGVDWVNHLAIANEKHGIHELISNLPDSPIKSHSPGFFSFRSRHFKLNAKLADRLIQAAKLNQYNNSSNMDIQTATLAVYDSVSTPFKILYDTLLALEDPEIGSKKLHIWVDALYHIDDQAEEPTPKLTLVFRFSKDGKPSFTIDKERSVKRGWLWFGKSATDEASAK